MDELEAKVARFPTRPGVYLMKDAQGRVLYVGKAKNLRARVRTYFREGADGRPRVRFLMARVADVDFVVTDTEKEALILENTLIKRHRPRYNVDLRDDKTYLSLRLDVQNPFPRLTMTRRIVPDGSLYFGPYSSARALRETVDLIHRIFPLRQCRDREFRARTRPCLYCQMRGCLAPCCGRVTPEAYREMVDQVVAFLRGRSRELLETLRARMAEAAERLEFEEAARLRDRIRAVEETLERQKAVTHRPVDRDVVAMVREGAEAEVVVLVVRSGNLIDRRSYYLPHLEGDDPEVMGQFLRQYYRGDRIVPAEVVVGVDVGEDEARVLGEWLSERRGRRVRVVHPRRGEKRALVAMAAENARELLDERRKTKVGYDAALAELRDRLGLAGPPRRIEGYDISNLQGGHAVGSMVVFTDGFPDPRSYRRFAIRTVEGSDDFAMLYEVLRRRLARRDQPGWELPDLVLIDGGRGQVAAAAKALEDEGGSVPLAGIAKARVLPGGGAEVVRSPERIFLPGRANPVPFGRNSSGLFLLQRVRDEAHRFALALHRKRRARASLGSALEAVPGVGPKRRQALLRRFGSLKRLAEAPVDEIAAVPGISEALARRIKEALAGEERRGG
ncbi:excinuclease ABC subunit UvrC [Deferrisoma camini]|uniref:excinuclease ABC subunit UvrC n=1 Tax=Deferrisoma camini TaxID=1035120 RepID=UPI00046D3E4C|nr:excinuclease ABC subunit UvrC [Deferrisoma camini]